MKFNPLKLNTDNKFDLSRFCNITGFSECEVKFKHRITCLLEAYVKEYKESIEDNDDLIAIFVGDWTDHRLSSAELGALISKVSETFTYYKRG